MSRGSLCRIMFHVEQSAHLRLADPATAGSDITATQAVIPDAR